MYAIFYETIGVTDLLRTEIAKAGNDLLMNVDTIGIIIIVSCLLVFRIVLFIKIGSHPLLKTHSNDVSTIIYERINVAKAGLYLFLLIRDLKDAAIKRLIRFSYTKITAINLFRTTGVH